MMKNLRTWTRLDPFGYCLTDAGKFTGLGPDRIAEEATALLLERLTVADAELFRFCIGELVSNCFLALPEYCFRVRNGGRAVGDRRTVLADLAKDCPKKEETLRLLYEETVGNKAVFSIQSDVSPVVESLSRVQERLTWSPRNAEDFILGTDGLGGDYSSVTGLAGMGIYMTRKELEKASGRLFFVISDEEGLDLRKENWYETDTLPADFQSLDESIHEDPPLWSGFAVEIPVRPG